MPVHVRQELGANEFWAGVLLGILWISSLSSRLVAGPYTDRNGRRSAMVIGCVACLCAGGLYLAPNIWLFALGRILHGSAEAFLLTAAAAAVVELAPSGRSSKGLGYLSSAVWGGLSLGPVVSAQIGSFGGVAYAIMAGSAAALFLVWNLAPDKPHEPHLAEGLQLRLVMRPGVILGLANVAVTVINGYLPLYVASRGGGASAAFTGFSITVLATRLLMGSLPDRLGPRTTLLGGLSVLMLALLVIIHSPSAKVTLAGAVLAGFGYSFPWPSLALVVISRVPVSKRGSGLAALTAYYDIFVAGGSVMLGTISQRAGLQPVFWTGVVAVAVAAAVAWNIRLATATESPTVREAVAAIE